MESVLSAIRNTVSISAFNKGMAGKIFEEVRKSGPRVVMKNNRAECVLLSPESYTSIMDDLNDAKLLTLAAQRLQNYDPNTLISLEEINNRYGITLEDIQDVGELEFE